jgi:hypothetical protein
MITELTYTENSTFTNNKSYVITAPVNWGLSPQGNQQMKKKANALIIKIIKTKNRDNSYSKKIKHIEQFISSYLSSCLNNKSFIGGLETLPRETVYSFIINIAKSSNIQETTVRDLWHYLKNKDA